MTTFIPWLPDKFSVTFEWLTDVLRAADGTEQRIAIWNHPKVTFALEYNMVGDEIDGDTDLARRVIRSTLTNNPDETYQIPLRYESSFLTADAANGATQLFLNYDRAIDWVGNGRKVYVEADENEDGYTALISSYSHIGSDVRLTLDTAAPNALDKTRVRVSPVVNIQPMDHQTLGRYRVEAGTWSITGVLQTLYMFNQGTGITVFTNTEGYNVWLREALQNSTDLLGEDFEAGWEIVGEPLMEAYSQFPKALIKRDLTFNLDGLDDWRYFKAILFPCLGQQVPFFRPTFRDDLTLNAQPSSPSNVLVVADLPNYADYYANADTFKRLALFLSNGSVLTVRVTSVTDLGSTLQLVCAETFARGANTIDRVAFLETTRLGSDAVTLTLDRGVRASINLQTLTGDWVPVP